MPMGRMARLPPERCARGIRIVHHKTDATEAELTDGRAGRPRDDGGRMGADDIAIA
jgi:hypothetical protein